MRLIIVPPLRLNEINGARLRTVEVYSRLGKDFDVTFTLDKAGIESAEAHYLSRLKGFKTVSVYIGKNPVKTFVSILKIALRARKTDVVLAYDSYHLSVAYSYVVSRIARKPLVIIVHLMEEAIRKRGFFMKRAFGYCSGILSLDNDAMLSELTQLFPEKSIMSVTNGVDWEQLSHEAEGRFKGIDCLYVGVLSERKGDGLLLRAWSRIWEQKPDSSLLVLAGVTPKDKIDSFRREASKRSNGRGVTVLGYVSEADKISAFRNSSVFVFPSNDEGFGLVIAEALAAGVPVVLWDLPPFGRFGKGVVKVSYPDANQLGDAVIRLLNDESYRTRLSNEATEFAKTCLSWDAAARLDEKALKILCRID